MQGICTYIPETNCVSRRHCCKYSVVGAHGAHTTISNVKSTALLHQYFLKYVSVPIMTVFCSSLISCFLNDLEMVTVARYYWHHMSLL